MIYKTDEPIEPFWAEFSSESNGRDPLAIQNSSVVIYSKTIRGITNVTNRIRYNGFYCWLMDSILKEVNKGERNSLDEQTRYIRRGELLLAFMMVNEYPEVTGVSGSSYAKNNIDTTIDLATGADWDSPNRKNKTYWQGKLGAFGQYFIGSMRDLDLIHYPKEDLNIYTITEHGSELAKAFRENISTESASVFMKAVLEGVASISDLNKLRTFSLTCIPEKSPEHIFYHQMLLEEDVHGEGVYHRRNSIVMLLQYLKNANEDIVNLQSYFLEKNYRDNVAKEIIEEHTSTSWYLYEISELLHLAYEHIHCNFLFSLEEYPCPLLDRIDLILKQASEALENDNTDPKSLIFQDYISIVKERGIDVYEHYSWMDLTYGEDDLGKCFVNAINVMIQVYINSEKHLPALKEYACKLENNFNRNGYAIELIDDFIESKRSLTVYDYMKQLLLTAINQHTFSSYRKTQIGQSLVHNYMIEDDNIWRIRGMNPSRTSPRLQNVTQYITDLGWIAKGEDKTLKITPLGIEISNIQ